MPVKMIAQTTGTSGVSAPKDNRTFLHLQLNTKASLESRDRDLVVAVLRNRDELAKSFLAATKIAEESAQKELESKLVAVLDCKELDWKKHMVVVAYQVSASRSPSVIKFTGLEVKGKTLHVTTELKSELNTAGGRGLAVAIVERVEVLDTITAKQARAR